MLKAVAEIFYGNSDALCVIDFNARTFAALTAYGDVKCLVALFFELVYGDVLADFNAALDFCAESLDYVDLGSDNILFKLVARNAVCHHTAGNGIFLEYRRLITHLSEIICGAESCGAAADDGDFLVK